VRILLSLATAITILAVALVLLLTPIWTHPALQVSYNAGDTLCTPQTDRAACHGLTGSDVVAASDQTIHALIFTSDFSFVSPNSTNGEPFYTEAEQSHMRDVRIVLFAFLFLAIVSAVFIVLSLVRRPRDAQRWKAIGRGGIWLVVAMVVLGLVAFVAFDTVFTLFHEIFFPGGNWSFPADSNLILVYPETFWELSSAALFSLSVIGALIVWFVARRRAAALQGPASAA
jgi:integral membrane protein (TIGR01906 family)